MISAAVNSKGRIQDVKVISNTANEASANVAIGALLDIRLPPIPDDVQRVIPNHKIDLNLKFTLHPN